MSPRFDSPPASPYSFSRPRPRPPRSSSQSAAIRVQNRRREYLLRNPSYFASTEHELADPLLYDSLIRRFQTPAEREAEGRAKGYARVLEGSLMRGEERLAKLAAAAAATAERDAATVVAETRKEGEEQWETYLRERFVRGGDEDFEYLRVDDDDEYDVLERMEQEEAWFDEEDPDWANRNGGGEGRRTRVERILQGETGVQDF
ncbi:hypothetical protein B0T17DRAFT_584115 [Bombardia bombarda]|uniref:CCD97-like C-terminal domain-containing protein n=1 Tax=Bombardia bombarda TaxID=252184 RepID=A0AA39W4S4_9PEZI|nr:hypothetical protein B0T17DRAFT_584115 [Bombardia bombarda]